MYIYIYILLLYTYMPYTYFLTVKTHAQACALQKTNIATQLRFPFVMAKLPKAIYIGLVRCKKLYQL